MVYLHPSTPLLTLPPPLGARQARSSLLSLKEGDLDFKYWRPFILFLCKTSVENGAYVPQRGMINLISQLMKRGKGLSVSELHTFVHTSFCSEYARSAERGARSAWSCCMHSTKREE